MWGELRKQDRDVVLNLCQYGRGEVWKWGAEVGNSWRTTDDLGWLGGSLSKGIFAVGLATARLADYAGPGHWNDPDYLLIGWVGDARKMGEGHPTTLTPDEQYTHVSMWALMAAPLIFSGDMERLDPFTLSLLCNHEVIDVDQDPLGRQARIARQDADVLVLVKELEDGSKAVGLFNLGVAPATIRVDAAQLGMTGPMAVRDIWRQKDLGRFEGGYQSAVRPHGVTLVRVAGAGR
jgi:alpha-galactosidase